MLCLAGGQNREKCRRKKINKIIRQKWHTLSYTFKKEPHNTTAGSLWLSLRSPDNKPGYWHLTDMPASTVWEKRPLGITENFKMTRREAQKLTVRLENKTDVHLITKKGNRWIFKTIASKYLFTLTDFFKSITSYSNKYQGSSPTIIFPQNYLSCQNYNVEKLKRLFRSYYK